MEYKQNPKFVSARKEAKKVYSNETYLKNFLLFIASIAVLIVSAGTFGLVEGALTSLSWWWKKGVEAIAFALMYLSVLSIFRERLRKQEIFQNLEKAWLARVFCANNNQHLRTYEGLDREAEEFNKKIMEDKWRRKLRRRVGSFYGTELAELNNSFINFNTWA